ncbi:MAG: NAD(P)-dependent oxidoreductase [Bryobacteraceae bacterium]
MIGPNNFRAGFSADFLDEQGHLVFPDIGLALLDADPAVSYEFLPEYKAEYAPEQLNGYDVLVSLKPKVTAASLAAASRLCAVGRCGVGYDNVDVAACTANDVALYITPEGVVKPMAESIVLFVLALSHNLLRKDRLVRQGRWAESTRPLGREPRDRIIGTIGMGNIATAALHLLGQFGVSRFLAFDPYTTPEKAAAIGVQLTGLEELLRESDYVLVNCPLTPQTRGLIGAAQLAMMKPTSYLINTARGPIVDEAALVESLQAGRIAGAALDVFAAEPLPTDSPLCTLENVILTSHSVGWTEELFRDMGRIDCEGVLAVSRGEAPANVVNREVLDRPGFRKKLEHHKLRRLETGA